MKLGLIFSSSTLKYVWSMFSVIVAAVFRLYLYMIIVMEMMLNLKCFRYVSLRWVKVSDF